MELPYRGRSVCGMPRGNPSPELAITVEPEVHRRVVAAAKEGGVSVSAWMTEAARRALLVNDGLTDVPERTRSSRDRSVANADGGAGRANSGPIITSRNQDTGSEVFC